MLKPFLLVITLAAVNPATPAAAAAAPQTANEQGVTVTVTPPDFSTRPKTWDFDVSLQTHTRNLNDDLAKSSALIADGKHFAPTAWEGAPPSGHHRKGILRFNAISPPPQSVELQIRLSGEAGARTFRWSLKGTNDGH